MEELIAKIIAKLRAIYRFTPYAEIIKQNPTIELFEIQGEIRLTSIRFSLYDTIIFYPTCITIEPEHGNRKVLAEFESIDEFLNS